MRPYKKSRFTCREKKTGETLQAIVYSDGKVLIGLDVWRLFDRHDTPSYEIQRFTNLQEALKRVDIVRTTKAYYLPNTSHTYY